MNQRGFGKLGCSLIYENKFLIIIICAFVISLYLDPTEVYNIFRNTPTFFYNTNPKEHWFYSFNDFLGPQHIFLMTTVYGLITFFGYTFLQGFFRRVSVNIVLQLSASFLVGYVCSLGIIRLVSYVQPHGFVFYPTIITILIISIIQFFKNVSTINREQTVPSDRKAIVISLFFLVFLFFLFLFVQVYAGEFAWVGHGPHQYSWALKFLRESKEVFRFPIITQHHDELLYTYLILDPIKISFNPILLMWVTLALNKVSFFSLIYCLFRFLKLKSYQAVIGSLFLLFGTNALNPLKYLMLYDSSNPLGYVVHSTRIVGIGIMLLVLVNTLNHRKDFGFLTLPFFIFTGIGLIFTTISNSFLILAMFFAAVLLLRYPGVCKFLMDNLILKKFKLDPIYIIHFIFLSCAFGYGILNTSIYSVPGLVHVTSGTFIFCLYGSFIFVNRKTVLYSEPPPDKYIKSALGFFVVFFLSTLFSALFLGNIFSQNSLNFFIVDFLNKYTFIDGLRIGQIGNNTHIHELSALEIFKDGRQLAPYNEYCRGFLYFLGYYGSIYILALCAFWSKVKSEVSDFTLKMKGLLLLTVSILPFLFFHSDFLIYTDKAWLKSRFLEIPIYFIIFSSIVLVFKSSEVRVKRLFSIFLLFYIVFPILGTHRLEQWIQNALALSSYLK